MEDGNIGLGGLVMSCRGCLVGSSASIVIIGIIIIGTPLRHMKQILANLFSVDVVLHSFLLW